MRMQQEQWKPVKGYEELYEVSNLGRVKSKTREFSRPHPIIDGVVQHISYKPKFVKFHITDKGYCRLGLYKDGVKKNHQVHRLVANSFIPNPENKEQVNHINGIKCDNRLENLEWVTNLENREHSYVHLGNQLHRQKI